MHAWGAVWRLHARYGVRHVLHVGRARADTLGVRRVLHGRARAYAVCAACCMGGRERTDAVGSEMWDCWAAVLTATARWNGGGRRGGRWWRRWRGGRRIGCQRWWRRERWWLWERCRWQRRRRVEGRWRGWEKRRRLRRSAARAAIDAILAMLTRAVLGTTAAIIAVPILHKMGRSALRVTEIQAQAMRERRRRRRWRRQ